MLGIKGISNNLNIIPPSMQGIYRPVVASEEFITPNYQGAGACTDGGAGGTVYEVTSLADTKSSPAVGTLRYAIEQSGPRIINIMVDGYIDLADRLSIRDPHVTINGDTSGGKGICLKDNRFVVETHDVIIRYIRSRPGDDISDGDDPDNIDAISFDQIAAPSADREVYNIIVDHCTFSWAIDGNVDLFNAAGSGTPIHNITIQWCIIADGLRFSLHTEQPHSTGMLIDDDSEKISIHHNLFVSNRTRNPRVRSENGLDVVSNCLFNIYNERMSWGQDDEINTGNLINNLEVEGPNSVTTGMCRIDLVNNCSDQENELLDQIYESGNVGISGTGWDNIMKCGFGSTAANTRFQAGSQFSTDCEDIFSEDPSQLVDVLANGTGYNHNGVGCSHNRDSRDTEILEQLIVARDQGAGSVDTSIIKPVDEPADVGGYPSLT